MMANATMNNLSATGTREPSSARTASANAMSVAMGMPKPDSVAVPRIQREVNQRRGDHAADGRESRQQRIAHLRQRAHVNAALELEADHQEKNRHQRVVDPVLDAHRPQFQVPEMQPGRGKRRVGEGQRYDGARHQQDAPELFGLDESPEGLMQHHGCANFSRE